MVGIDIGENSLFPGPDDPIYEVVDNGEPGAGNDMLRGTFLPAQTDCSTYPFSRLEQPRTLLEMGNYLGSRGVAGAGWSRPSDAIAGPAPLLHDSHASGGGRLTEALIEVGENYSVGPYRIQDAA